MRIYLAGPINGCTDDEANGWRAEAKRLLAGHECIDPMDRDYRGREAENVAAIVDADLLDIESADAVLVNATRASWGTAMEVRDAWCAAKRVVAFCPAPVSPWLAYHAEVVPTLSDAIALLNSTPEVPTHV